MGDIATKILEIEAGQYIIEQGESGCGFYVLNSGSLEVYKDNVLLTVLNQPGTIFGEMGDILGKPRTCTVRAKSSSQVIQVVASDMKDLVEQNPAVAVKIIRTLASRLESTTKKLADKTIVNTIWSISD